jgi:hypothetical protein
MRPHCPLFWDGGCGFALRTAGAFGIAVAEQDGARRSAADEIEQLVAIGMGGEIKVLHVTTLRHLPHAGAETSVAFSTPNAVGNSYSKCTDAINVVLDRIATMPAFNC